MVPRWKFHAAGCAHVALEAPALRGHVQGRGTSTPRQSASPFFNLFFDSSHSGFSSPSPSLKPSSSACIPARGTGGAHAPGWSLSRSSLSGSLGRGQGHGCRRENPAHVLSEGPPPASNGARTQDLAGRLFARRRSHSSHSGLHGTSAATAGRPLGPERTRCPRDRCPRSSRHHRSAHRPPGGGAGSAAFQKAPRPGQAPRGP